MGPIKKIKNMLSMKRYQYLISVGAAGSLNLVTNTILFSEETALFYTTLVTLQSFLVLVGNFSGALQTTILKVKDSTKRDNNPFQFLFFYFRILTIAFFLYFLSSSFLKQFIPISNEAIIFASVLVVGAVTSVFNYVILIKEFKFSSFSIFIISEALIRLICVLGYLYFLPSSFLMLLILYSLSPLLIFLFILRVREQQLLYNFDRRTLMIHFFSFLLFNLFLNMDIYLAQGLFAREQDLASYLYFSTLVKGVAALFSPLSYWFINNLNVNFKMNFLLKFCLLFLSLQTFLVLIIAYYNFLNFPKYYNFFLLLSILLSLNYLTFPKVAHLKSTQIILFVNIAVISAFFFLFELGRGQEIFILAITMFYSIPIFRPTWIKKLKTA